MVATKRTKKSDKKKSKGEKTQKTLTTIVLAVILVLCVGVLVQKTVVFTNLYLDKPTVTSVFFRNEHKLQFPAVTLCESLLKQASTNSGIPMVSTRPNYASFPFKNLTVNQFLWKYSFTLNDVVQNCRIGQISCWAEENRSFLLSNNSREVETETKAGVWISRFQVQSGEHALCHTFLTNLTVDMENGVDKILLKVTPTVASLGSLGQQNKKSNELSKWKIMVHEREEMGLFEGYNINIPPLFIIVYTSLGSSDQKKIKFSPVKRIGLDKSTSHCNESFSYSRQRCLLECSWKLKLDIMSLLKNITCLPLGLYVPAESAYGQLPVCSHATVNDSKTGSPGYYEFASGVDDNFFAALDGPASICTSQCLPRCQKIEYNPQEQAILPRDLELNKLSGFDMKLYFASTEVQVMEDSISYSGDNLFADLSGISGTLLGVSFLGLAELFVKALSRMQRSIFG